MTAKELRQKARLCRQRAACATGDKYHRELQRARHLEAEASEREAWLAQPKQPQTQGAHR